MTQNTNKRARTVVEQCITPISRLVITCFAPSAVADSPAQTQCLCKILNTFSVCLQCYAMFALLCK